MEPADFIQALRELYTAIDAEMAGCRVACEGCSDCCDPRGDWFAPQPYLLEVDAIRRQLDRGRRGWPVTEFEGACVFLADGLCTVYEVRPFHCRTFSCSGKALGVHLRFKAGVEKLCSDYAHSMGKAFSAYPFSLYSIECRPGRQDWLDAT